MTVLAFVIACALWPIAALHLVWAFGKTWPFATEEHLAQTVGGPSLDPSIGSSAKVSITLVAAGAIAVAGLIPIAYAGILSVPVPQFVLFWLLVFQIIVFLARGAFGYCDITPASAFEPFRTYNRRYYSPFVIALGMLCAAILFLS